MLLNGLSGRSRRTVVTNVPLQKILRMDRRETLDLALTLHLAWLLLIGQ